MRKAIFREIWKALMTYQEDIFDLVAILQFFKQEMEMLYQEI